MIATALLLTFLAAACFAGLALSMAPSRTTRVERVEVREVPTGRAPYIPSQRVVRVESVVTSTARTEPPRTHAEQRYAQVRALPSARTRRRVRADL